MAITSIRKMVGILSIVMIGMFVVWETFEWSVLRIKQPEGLVFYYLMRAASTAVIMSLLTAWLLMRYRRRYEDQLRMHSEESRRVRVFFQNIVQDAGEAIIGLDKDDVICAWNRSAEEIYGYRADEILGRSVNCLFPADLLASEEPARIRELVKSKGFMRNLEARRVRKDGSIIDVRITRSVLKDEHGSVIGSSAIVSDITASKEMEARLIQSEKLAAIGETAATIAHEVRNALAGIGGTVEVLKGSPLWDELPEGVGEEVQLQVSRIAHIVNDLLAYARPGRLLPQPTDIHRVLDRAILALASTPEAGGKKIIREYVPGSIQVEIDPARLEQAFQNVITNAYQSMGPGGTLRIATSRTDGFVDVSFVDSGSGISREVQSRAFEPFYTTKARGTGLGLPIVKTIIEAHHGRIGLTSTPGAGTKVTLSLPASDTARDKETTPCSTHAGAG
jgi:two-component system, sporulation sensor kinase E